MLEILSRFLYLYISEETLLKYLKYIKDGKQETAASTDNEMDKRGGIWRFGKRSQEAPASDSKASVAEINFKLETLLLQEEIERKITELKQRIKIGELMNESRKMDSRYEPALNSAYREVHQGAGMK